jgi:hypothetical protein
VASSRWCCAIRLSAASHRRLRYPERGGDLRGGQPPDRAQGERDLAGGGQVRMTAAEQQGQRVVGAGRFGVGRGAEQLRLSGLPVLDIARIIIRAMMVS